MALRRKKWDFIEKNLEATKLVPSNNILVRLMIRDLKHVNLNRRETQFNFLFCCYGIYSVVSVQSVSVSASRY